MPPTRYDRVAQALHWLTALLIFAILPIAWHMIMLARDNPQRETWYTVHKSIGITILALAVLRLVSRGLHPPPPLPDTMSKIEDGAAVLSHWLLYVVLLAMPISGYLLSAAGGHPVSYFGLFEIPNLVPQSPTLSRAGATVHILGQWAVYALIVLHLAATAWHIVVRRDASWIGCCRSRLIPLEGNPVHESRLLKTRTAGQHASRRTGLNPPGTLKLPFRRFEPFRESCHKGS